VVQPVGFRASQREIRAEATLLDFGLQRAVRFFANRGSPLSFYPAKKKDTPPALGFEKVACKSFDNCTLLVQIGSGGQRHQP
jgi:hypothetical protein